MDSITLTTVLTVVGLFMTSIGIPLGWLFVKQNNQNKALEALNKSLNEEIKDRKIYEAQFKANIEQAVEAKLISFRTEYQKDVQDLKVDFAHVIRDVQNLNTQITTRVDALILSLMEKKG